MTGPFKDARKTTYLNSEGSNRPLVSPIPGDVLNAARGYRLGRLRDQIARHESDTTGDGFRDRVRFYRAGTLAREEQDNDGDGQAEVTLHYDAASQVTRRDEDTDGDGQVDVISHYEDGRLARRELLGDGPAPEAP